MTARIPTFILSGLLLLLTSSPLYAQTITPVEGKITSENRMQRKEDSLEKRQLLLEEKAKNEAERKAYQETMKQKQLELKEKRLETKTLMIEKQELLKARQQEMQETMQLKREDAKERNQVKREEFTKRLEIIKDTRKKEIVERTDEKLETINTNRTNSMSQTLEKLSSLLSKIAEKTTTAKANGRDTAAIEATIATAQTAITTAQTAVTTQAGKTYVAQINDETTLKNTVGTTVKQLQTDLQITHKTVVDAKQAVQNVLKTIGTIRTETKPTETPEE